jgi:hypothetical protein
MTITDWLMVVATALGIITTLAGALRWVVRSFLVELKPNSGTSLKDAVTRLERQVDEIYRILLERR